MDNLLRQLGGKTLSAVVNEFVQWCVWQQARQALVLVLEEAKLAEIAENIQSAKDLPAVIRFSEKAKEHIESLRAENDLRGLSAAEGAVFEFINMAKSAEETHLDAEAVSFFASRVCGWAGWAVTGFNNIEEKNTAEKSALQAQEAYLASLWQKHQSTGDK